MIKQEVIWHSIKDEGFHAIEIVVIGFCLEIQVVKFIKFMK